MAKFKMAKNWSDQSYITFGGDQDQKIAVLEISPFLF